MIFIILPYLVACVCILQICMQFSMTTLLNRVAVTPHFKRIWVNFCRNKTTNTPCLWAFHADFNHVNLKMILWPQLEGNQSYGTLGQALPPVSAVTKGSNPLSLLPKQAGGLGQGCSRTGCPLIAAMGSF